MKYTVMEATRRCLGLVFKWDCIPRPHLLPSMHPERESKRKLVGAGWELRPAQVIHRAALRAAHPGHGVHSGGLHLLLLHQLHLAILGKCLWICPAESQDPSCQNAPSKAALTHGQEKLRVIISNIYWAHTHYMQGAGITALMHSGSRIFHPVLTMRHYPYSLDKRNRGQ